MPRRISNIFLMISIVLFCLVLIYATKYLLTSDTVHTNLEKVYFLGGTISGIFAFGAFIVAYSAFSEQRKISKIQRFENTFFNMMALQQQIVNDLSYDYTETEIIREDAPPPATNFIRKEVVVNKKTEGRGLFEHSFIYIDLNYDGTNLHGMQSILTKMGLEGYSESYIPTIFDHYFRHLYRIIRFVDSTTFLSNDDKYKYTSMVRATLSPFEIIWIYYNCLTPIGNQKFKPLLEKYTILKNIRKEFLVLCLNNKNKLTDKISVEYIKSKGFSGKDYEFFMTNDKSNKEVYHIGAFHTKYDLNTGNKIVNEWMEFFKVE